MNKTEATAITTLCAAGCLIIEAVGYWAGWTSNLAEATASWLIYTVVTSATVMALTYRSRNKKNDDK